MDPDPSNSRGSTGLGFSRSPMRNPRKSNESTPTRLNKNSRYSDPPATTPLPKFGDWNMNNPTAEDYSAIFEKAVYERRGELSGETPQSSTAGPAKKQSLGGGKSFTGRFCCCFTSAAT